MRYVAAVFMVLLLAIGGDQAAAQTKHQALLELEARGHQVEFLGNEYGLDGWLIQNDNGRVQYGYSTPEGGFVLGMMFGADGKLRTGEQLKDYRARTRDGGQAAIRLDNRAEKSAAPRSERMYAEIENAKWFAIGSADAPYMYTFVNPTCAHCVDFWQDHMKEVVDDGLLQIRFVPFGAQEQNREAAALLLGSGRGEELWRRYADGDAGAFDEEADIGDGIYRAVDLNTRLFTKWKLPVTPFSIYRAPVDGSIKVVSGIPDNVMMLMADFAR